MDKDDILLVIRSQLANEFCCDVADLDSCNVKFTVNYTCRSPYIKIMTFNQSVIISTSAQLFSKVKKSLTGRNRDEIFEFPLVFGQTIHYIPDVNKIPKIILTDTYTYELLQGDNVKKLRCIAGFDNSLGFDGSGNTPTTICFYAQKGDTVIGLAGASVKAKNIWEVGVDIKPECRNDGLGTKLVSYLTVEILKHGIVPVYSASVTNIGSQMVANRSGYIPCWVDTYGNILDGSSPYTADLQSMHIYNDPD